MFFPKILKLQKQQQLQRTQQVSQQIIISNEFHSNIIDQQIVQKLDNKTQRLNTVFHPPKRQYKMQKKSPQLDMYLKASTAIVNVNQKDKNQYFNHKQFKARKYISEQQKIDQVVEQMKQIQKLANKIKINQEISHQIITNKVNYTINGQNIEYNIQ